MSDTLLRPRIPDHVPANMVRAFEMTHGHKTLEDPFERIIPDLLAGPAIFFAPEVFSGPAWIVRKAEDIEEIYRSTDTFKVPAEVASFGERIGETWKLIPSLYDPPEHGKYRALMNPLFGPRIIAAQEDRIRLRAREFVTPLRERSRCEFMSEFAFKFPIAVFMTMLGAPREDEETLVKLVEVLIHSADDSAKADAIHAAKAYIVAALESRENDPRDDFFSAIVTARIDDRPLTSDERIGMGFALLIGGLDTISSTLGLFLRYLANHPVEQRALRDDPLLIPDAVEELHRAFSGVTGYRRCIRDTAIKGVRIMRGDLVAMPFACGGRDADRYDQPDRIRFDRRPRHLGFAHGPHLCVAMHLARRELCIAVEEFLEAIPLFRIPDGAKIETTLGLLMHLDTLPIEWDARC